ncbi:MAG: NAD(P)H-hydrate dehydratase, partial [Bacteroidales bacterium]|nr:NAD(P)H-hydrate dehydratase [Bacteroidales bacterium]
QFPKLMMLLPEMAPYVGELQVIDIGLHPDFIQQIRPVAVLLEDFLISGLLKSRSKFAHKGHFGHVLLIAGSHSKSGAAIMAAQACLRSGTGLLTVHAPEAVILPLRSALPEAMFSLDPDSDCFSQLPEIELYNSIAIGPGLGINHETASAFKLLIQQTSVPLVIDADALNILSKNPTWLAFLPAGSILTPHIGEFDRLTGKSEHSYHRIQKQIELSKKFGIYVILKGANSSISCPDGTLYINNTGNPGMATGGSGDVLTGILAGLLAQGYSSHDTAVLGVYLHGLAGDIALNHQSEESLLASDIVENLGEAFNFLRQTGKDFFGFKSRLNK